MGVCFATSGPGATNLTTGIGTAYMDSSPVVFITCNVTQNLIGRDAFQEVDITGIAMPITKSTYLVRDVKVKGLPILAPLPPVITNVVIVGFELACLSDAGTFGLGNFTWAAFGTSALSVGIGELVVCYVLGLPLILALERTKAVSRLAV